MPFELEEYLMGSLLRARRSASASGGEITAVCPSCEKYGGFYANPRSGKYVCFKCGFRGRSAVGIVALLENLTFVEARSFLFRNTIEVRRKSDLFTVAERVRWLRDSKGDNEELLDIPFPPGVNLCFDNGRWRLPSYLKGRKIKSRTAAHWGLGFSDKLYYRFPDADKDTNLSWRLFIPIECPFGRSWTARDTTGERLPRYLNPAGADHRKMLIGWSKIRMTGDLVICEGPMDAIKLWQHDVSAVALGGKELHDEQLAQLVKLPRDTSVTVMLDPEELEAPRKVAARLSVHFSEIYLAKLPEGVDPGSSTMEQAHSAMESAVRWAGGRSVSLQRSLRAMERRWS